MGSVDISRAPSWRAQITEKMNYPILKLGVRSLSLSGLLCLAPFTSMSDSNRSDDLDTPVPMWSVTYPDGEALLELVRNSLPDVPMKLEAELRVRGPRIDNEPVGRAELLMWFRDGVGEARYIVRDWFGREEEELTVVRAHGAPPQYLFRTGSPLEEAPLPDLAGTIRGTDLTWGDLSLAYLWWPGARTVGQQSVRGRRCYIVEVPAPEAFFDALSHVRIWIDPTIGMLLRAQAFASDGKPLRTLDARRFRKIDEMWMVSHLEILRHAGRQRTTMLVHSLTIDGLEQTGTLTADDTDSLR